LVPLALQESDHVPIVLDEDDNLWVTLDMKVSACAAAPPRPRCVAVYDDDGPVDAWCSW
jgi:hypothetical protein